MALGFCPYLLYHINDVVEGNSPGTKIRPNGFLSMLLCCQQSNASILNDTYDGSHTRPVQIKYRERPLLSAVQSESDCDINTLPAYKEFAINALQHRQISFFLDDDKIYQYCRDASNLRNVGAPPSGIMQEVYEEMIMHVNTLMAAINEALLAAQSTEFGENVTTGSYGGKIININTNTDALILNNGIAEMLSDLDENEICGDICMVGGGLWNKFDKTLVAQCCASNGIDISRLGIPTFYYDKASQRYWGNNSVGVFAPGSTKFLTRLRYGNPAFAGAKGSSFFTTMAFPVQEFSCGDECLSSLVFDVQLRYIDCPTTLTVNGVNTAVTRGWQVIISKDFGLFTQPDNLYPVGDELEGTNGTLKYYISNVPYNGAAYSAYAY